MRFYNFNLQIQMIHGPLCLLEDLLLEIITERSAWFLNLQPSNDVYINQDICDVTCPVLTHGSVHGTLGLQSSHGKHLFSVWVNGKIQELFLPVWFV